MKYLSKRLLFAENDFDHSTPGCCSPARLCTLNFSSGIGLLVRMHLIVNVLRTPYLSTQPIAKNVETSSQTLLFHNERRHLEHQVLEVDEDSLIGGTQRKIGGRAASEPHRKPGVPGVDWMERSVVPVWRPCSCQARLQRISGVAVQWATGFPIPKRIGAYLVEWMSLRHPSGRTLANRLVRGRPHAPVMQVRVFLGQMGCELFQPELHLFPNT